MQKVSFNDSEGNDLVGILSDPSGNKEHPIIILCHGFTSSKESSTYVNLERILNEKGFATLRFDFYGHGESEGKFEDVTISRASDGILSAIDFLKNAGYSKIGLFGASFGGICSIITASKTKELFLLVLKCPVSNYLEKLLAKYNKAGIDEWKENGFIWHVNGRGQKFRLNYSFFEDSTKCDGYEAAKNISIPTLIIHGDADPLVPVEQSRKTASIIKDCMLEIITGADHKFSKEEDYNKVLELVTGFILDHS